ncbi:24043_t:CDS:2, partial [Dentiscutata erythropus]
KTVRKAIWEKMETIKYLSNEHLEIVSKTALKNYNKNKRNCPGVSKRIKIKVKKALTEVFDTIQACFVDLESPKNPDNPNFTWQLAVLEQVYPEETTKNNIAFAVFQKYVVHEMNLALKGMESDELEIEIECEGNKANYIEEEEE